MPQQPSELSVASPKISKRVPHPPHIKVELPQHCQLPGCELVVPEAQKYGGTDPSNPPVLTAGNIVYNNHAGKTTKEGG
jgi:hypothetical protein